MHGRPLTKIHIVHMYSVCCNVMYTTVNLGEKTTALRPNQFVAQVKEMHKMDEGFKEEFKVSNTQMHY